MVFFKLTQFLAGFMVNLVLIFENLSRLKEVPHLLRAASAASADSCVGFLAAENLQPDSVLPLLPRASPVFQSCLRIIDKRPTAV